MSRTYRESCGCRHDGHKWVVMCEACEAGFQERHQRALAEHQSMGIKAEASSENAAAHAPALKAAPTPGGVSPGFPSSVAP